MREFTKTFIKSFFGALAILIFILMVIDASVARQEREQFGHEKTACLFSWNCRGGV